jgi:hypothetical protein
VNVGGFTSDAAGVDDLLTRLRAGSLEEGRMYTASIFVNQCGFSADETAGYARFIDDHAADVASGDLVWATLPEVVRIWREDYASAPVILQAGEPTACGTCPPDTVCCESPLPCEGSCVPDCRVAGNPCPPAVPTCDADTGLCGDAVVPPVLSELLTVPNPTSGEDWWVKTFYPEDANATNRYPAILSVPGGSGAGSETENLADPYRNPAQQAARGFVVVIFDAEGRGNTGGTEDYCGHRHQDGLKAVIEAVAGLPYVDGARLGLSTSSFGITMGSGVLARYPALPVRFLVDVEGPADRNDTGHCDASDTGHITHDCTDEAWWSEREAATFIQQIQPPYLRLQHVQDHAQPDNLHCILMIGNATAAGHGGSGVSSWTRVNTAGENAPNLTYTEASPPVYTDNTTQFDLPAFWAEMFALQP